jgi:hypothetical protein
LPPGKPVVSRETPAPGANGRQDDASDLRPGTASSPTARALRRSCPASGSKPKKPADSEPEDVRQ